MRDAHQHSPRRQRTHVVTEARPSLSEDIAYRQRRYLIMMGIRAVCFITAVLMFANHLGWLTAIPVVGAIAIPYFAVVFANAGREPSSSRGFRPYEPNLPERWTLPAGTSGTTQGPPAEPGTPGGSGAPPHNA